MQKTAYELRISVWSSDVCSSYLLTDGDGDNFSRDALFLQADRFLNSDFVKRIHGHLDVGKISACSIHLHPRFDIIVNDPLDGHQDFHLLPPKIGSASCR